MLDNPQHNKKEPVVENKNSLAYGSRTMDPAITLVDRALEIEKADETIKSHVHSKLELIGKQIKALQQEAQAILETAETDAKLHRVKCNFEKRIGDPLHLYEKNGSELYFSKLSPSEWNNNPPHKFIGSYIMHADRSFKKIED